MKETKIISAFPGTGKTFLFEHEKNSEILDSDSSKFSWADEEQTERHPDFPQNYIDHIKTHIGKVDTILVSTHKEIRNALAENNIFYTLVYPNIELKAEYKERFIERGNDDAFIKMIDENWDRFIKDIMEEMPINCNLVQLETGDYLFNRVIGLGYNEQNQTDDTIDDEKEDPAEEEVEFKEEKHIVKAVCIYHSRDLDGWMSAAIVKKWFNNKEVPNKEGEPINTIDFLGWDYGCEIPNLDIYTDIYMTDISFPPAEMLKIQESGKSFVWCDHHISAITEIENYLKANDVASPFGKRDVRFAACELTWENLYPDKEMPELVRLLGRYDCFGHKGTEEEQKVLEFQYAARAFIDGYEKAFEYLMNWTPTWTDTFLNQGVAVYKYLCTEAKQTYTKAFPIKFDNTQRAKTDISGAAPTHLKFLAVNQERFNPINFGINYHLEGYDGFACFWYKNGKWNWSLYNDNEKVDCSIIAKSYGGGGHKGASGFLCDSAILKIILHS